MTNEYNKSIAESSTTTSMSWLDNFVDVYQKLSINNLELLDTVYHPQVVFEDPLHKLQGIKALHHYFSGMYQNLTFCNFLIQNILKEGECAGVYWEMTYQHPKLNKGQTVTVLGHSHLKMQDNKIIYHRDYLDLGVMLYEQLPLIGKLIRWVKLRATK
jgi:limonene-1,2-epoxide hydrolase